MFHFTLNSRLYIYFYKLLYSCMRILAWTRIYPSKQPTLANCTAHKTVFSKGIKMDFFLNDNLSLLQKHYKWHETWTSEEKKKNQNLKPQEQHQKTTHNQTLDSQNCDYTRFCFQSTGAQNKFPTMRRNYHAFSILLLWNISTVFPKAILFLKSNPL